MKKSKIARNLASVIFTCYAAIAFADPPHWDHSEQQTWWAIEDASQEAPLKYPYGECGVGKHQSPIDFAAAEIDKTEGLNELEIWYDIDTTPVYFNSGHGIQVNTSLDYMGELKIGEESYPLIQFHFHAPSEHVIGDKKFPAELHYVHIRKDGRMVVLAVAVNVGEESSTFQTILNNVPHQAGERNENTGIQINPAALLPPISHQETAFYTYAGSLTTPPCSEGVQWYILREAITISAAQLDQLKGFYNNDVRSTQDLNGRAVLSTE